MSLLYSVVKKSLEEGLAWLKKMHEVVSHVWHYLGERYISFFNVKTRGLAGFGGVFLHDRINHDNQISYIGKSLSKSI